MDRVTRQEPARCNNPNLLGKAGWVKKAPCRLLAKYKDRYIQVERTDVAVYENEDPKSCIERLDLQNYEKCHELKSPFMRKHRLVLIRSLKSGNKIHDMKFQARTAEEKEAWIQALSDGISRAKNKVLDEVKMDDSSHLQHFTRERAKGNRNRRPPTRIHMKELAELSFEGSDRLPDRTYSAKVYGTDVFGETDNHLEKPDKAEVEESKAPMLLMAPPQETKTVPADESTDGSTSKQSPAPRTKTGPPALPPKLTSSYSGELARDCQLRQQAHPPTPPTKDKKPSPASQLQREAIGVPEDPVCKRDTTPCTEGFVSDEEAIKDAIIQPTGGHTTPTSQAEEGSACEDATENSTCTDVLNTPSCARVTPPGVPPAAQAPPRSSKIRAASFGDLLCDPPDGILALRASIPSEASSRDLADVEKELTRETATTNELMSRARRSSMAGEDGRTPEDLLTEAMDKLKKADQVLRDVKKLKLAKSLSKRKSW